MAAISLLAGWMSWQLLERHVLALKRLFPQDDNAPDRVTGALPRVAIS
jgi:hypothetical protein